MFGQTTIPASFNVVEKLGYKDLKLRLAVSFPVAVYLVYFGEDIHPMAAVTDLGFWTGVAVSYLICLGVLTYINRMCFLLDRHLPWESKMPFRILIQAVLCLAIPAWLAYMAVAYFLQAHEIDITETTYAEHELRLVIVLLIAANIYYVAYYFIWRSRQHHPLAQVPETQQEITEPARRTKKLFLAQTKERVITVPQDDIAAIYIESGYVLLRTFGRETEMLAQPLAKVAEELDPDIFFRINQQYVVHYRICRDFRHIPNGKLEISLGAPVNRTEEVTRTRVQDFLEWLKK